jgi:hypothetical protein
VIGIGVKAALKMLAKLTTNSPFRRTGIRLLIRQSVSSLTNWPKLPQILFKPAGFTILVLALLRMLTSAQVIFQVPNDCQTELVPTLPLEVVTT